MNERPFEGIVAWISIRFIYTSDKCGEERDHALKHAFSNGGFGIRMKLPFTFILANRNSHLLKREGKSDSMKVRSSWKTSFVKVSLRHDIAKVTKQVAI